MNATKRQLSVSARLRQFYEDNPNEMLTIDDIVLKFGCTRKNAQWAVFHLKRSKFVGTMQVVVKEPA